MNANHNERVKKIEQKILKLEGFINNRQQFVNSFKPYGKEQLQKIVNDENTGDLIELFFNDQKINQLKQKWVSDKRAVAQQAQQQQQAQPQQQQQQQIQQQQQTQPQQPQEKGQYKCLPDGRTLPYIIIKAHPNPGNRSVIVDYCNFKIENSRGPHVEILNKDNQDLSKLPKIGATYNVGPAHIEKYNNNAIVRQIYFLKRQDGNPAHITVYYGADAQQKLSEFQ